MNGIETSTHSLTEQLTNNIELIPEWEVKEEPYDYYEDVTNTGSPCWISEAVSLVGENGVDHEFDDCIQVEDNSDAFDYASNNFQSKEELAPDIQATIQTLAKEDEKANQNSFKQPFEAKKLFMPFEVDFDEDFDNGFEIAMENVSGFEKESDDFSWKKKSRSMTSHEIESQLKELDDLLTKCRINVQVMQARLDEERGKMLRIQNSLVNLKRRQKRQERRGSEIGGSGNDTVSDSSSSSKKSQIKIKQKNSEVRKGFEEKKKKLALKEAEKRMKRLRVMKAKKVLQQKSSGIIDYKKELENKLMMARVREIKFQKALERKLSTSDKLSPEAKMKVKVKPINILKQVQKIKQEGNSHGENYEKMLEKKLKMARLREIKAKKALDKLSGDGSDKGEEIKDKRTKIKKIEMKKTKIKKVDKPLNGNKDIDMNKKMAHLREIKAKKAIERKKLENVGTVKVKIKKEENVLKKKSQPKKKKLDDNKKQSSGEGKVSNGIKNAEESNVKPEIHIATSHMLWNVLSRIKLEPYRKSKSECSAETSPYLSNQPKNDPLLIDVPKRIKEFMLRDDVSKVSTIIPHSTHGSKTSQRYRMHYLPILHKQFEAEHGNVCSYASFCDNVPENVMKPYGWQWKFCPCMPCINPELKFEKMISEGILKMDGIELGDVLHDETKENVLMLQLKALKESRQFFTYDSWEKNNSGSTNARRRTASEPISIVVDKFLEELSNLKSHIQRSFYQYHAAKLARDRSLRFADEVTLHIECSPLSVSGSTGTEQSTSTSSESTTAFTFLTGHLWSQNCEQTLAAFSENKDYSISGIWAGLEKILLSVVKAGKKKINIISDCPTNKYRNKSNFYYMSDFARTYGVCFRWIFLELSHQMGNANMIRDDIERTIKEQLKENPNLSLAKEDIKKMLHVHTSIIVDSFSQEDLQKYKTSLPKLRAVHGTQKFDEVIILPKDFWVRDVIGFDTFKKLSF